MPVSIRLGPALEERLARASRKLRLNKTEVIKRSLEAYLTDIDPGRTPYALGKELFGADDGPAANRSVGYKHRLKSTLRGKHHR